MPRERPSIEYAFAELVRASTEDHLATWLRRGLLAADFTPIALPYEPSAEAQLQDLFETLPHDSRDRFRRAVLLALSTWSPGADGPGLLENLAVLAAYIREPRIVDYVRKVIVEGWLDPLDEDSRFQMLQKLVAVVGGFAPHPDVRALFETLYAAPMLDERLAAQLFIGLCRCDVQRYPEYVPQLIRILRSRPEYFRLDYLFAEFVSVVGLATIARRFMAIDADYREDFQHFLCELPSSPARILLVNDTPCIAPNPYFEALGPDYQTDTSAYFLSPPPDAPAAVTDTATHPPSRQDTVPPSLVKSRTEVARLVRRQRDATLIYEVLQTTQDMRDRSKEGISPTLANKTLCSVLRHWYFLMKHVPGYERCREWDTKMMLYRFGAVAYQDPGPGAPHGDNPFDVWFLRDVVLHDPLLRDLGATVVTPGPPSSPDRYLLRFGPPPTTRLSRYKSLLDMSYFDTDLARTLATLYSRLPALNVYAVATCPTADCTVESITAELRMWHHDWRHILASLDPDGRPDRIRPDEVPRSLDSAFICTVQARNKVDLYAQRTPQASEALKQLSLSMADSDYLIEPFADRLGDGTPTDQITTMAKLATNLRTFTAWVYMLMRQVGIVKAHSRMITDREIEVARQHMHRLADLGLQQPSTKLQALAARRDHACLAEFHRDLVELTHLLEDVLDPAGVTFNTDTILDFFRHDPDIAAPTLPESDTRSASA